MNTNSWYDGLNDYKKITLVANPETKKHTFTVELLDVETNNYNSIYEVYSTHLSNRQTKFVEVLFSGGLDSEFALHTCLKLNIPVRAITARLLVNNCPINTHDLYYSERFCRANNIEHKIVDIDAKTFFENGDHIKYLEPYYITEAHVATLFKLLEMTTGFPILGGEYSWPWIHGKILSPHRHHFNQFDRFMKDNGINGIGNMIGHSLESNMTFIKEHLAIQTKLENENNKFIPILKQSILNNLGYNISEPRLRSYGWERLRLENDNFNINMYCRDLMIRFGTVESNIVWNTKIAQVLGSNPGSNSLHK